MTSRKKSSEMRNYFTITDKDKTKAKCDMCGHVLSYKSSVSNLKKHIQGKHPTVSVGIQSGNEEKDCAESGSKSSRCEGPIPSTSVESSQKCVSSYS